MSFLDFTNREKYILKKIKERQLEKAVEEEARKIELSQRYTFDEFEKEIIGAGGQYLFSILDKIQSARELREYATGYLLVQGRLLRDKHIDPATDTDEYFYRKVLQFNPNNLVTLLSKEGSESNLSPLDLPDREFTIKEMYNPPIGDYKVMPTQNIPQIPKNIELIVDSEMVLRKFRPEDARVIFELIDRNREHLSQNDEPTADKYPTYESVLESIVHQKNLLRIRFGIWVNDLYVGTRNITLQDDNPSAEVGCYIGKEFTNKGYSTKSLGRIIQYAIEDLKLQEVFARVNKNNAPSLRVMQKAGFTQISEKTRGDKLYYHKPLSDS
jgi:ribosomal-protein-serine acetyltransferase